MEEPQLLQPVAQADPKIGMVLQDRYKILRLLGEGGMGAVYEAEHVLIKKRVAVKCLHPQYAQNSQVVARFHREALAATSIGHPNIIEVHDLGRFPDGSVFMVLELLEGRDFAHLIDEEGPQPLDRVVHILLQICDALLAAHAKGIVHRDLKPENVFLVRRGEDPHFVKLLDFGISKMKSASDAPGSNMTRTGMALGTPYYMAPEQAQGRKDVDHRADIYALGVILFRALTGQHPFDHDSYPMLVLKICTEPPPPLLRYRPDLPPEIEQIAAKMLAKNPNDRYPDCAAVKAALKPFENHSSVPVVNEVPRNDTLPLPDIVGHAQTALGPGVAPSPLAADRRTARAAAGPGPTAEPKGTPLSTQTDSSPGVPGRSRAPLFATIALGTVVVGGGFAALASGALAPDARSSSGKDEGAEARTGPASTGAEAAGAIAGTGTSETEATAAVADGAGAARERKVHVEITTVPQSAEIFIDGRRRFNPFNADLAYNPELRTLEVRAEGYKTLLMDLDLTEDQKLNVVLERGVGTSDQRRAATRGPSGSAASPGRGASVPSPTAASASGTVEGEGGEGSATGPGGDAITPRAERPRTTAAPQETPAQVTRPADPEPAPPDPDVVAPPPRRGFKNLSGI
jgi:serine/threonine-protein kinase